MLNNNLLNSIQWPMSLNRLSLRQSLGVVVMQAACLGLLISCFGCGGSVLGNGDKYYYELAEGAMLAIKQAPPHEFKSIAESVQPLIQELEEGTKSKSTEVSAKLHECAVDLFPKLVKGTARERQQNLPPIEKALESLKSKI